MSDQIIINKTVAFVQKHMSQYDASHNMAHVMRVHNNALTIAADDTNVNVTAIKLAALMHDTNDHKYVTPDPTFISVKLMEFGADSELATFVETIITHVSYTYETQHGNTPEYIQTMQILECAIVQDADRLDALGQDGIERTIAYNTAKGKNMSEVIKHFHDKLYKLPKLMKTPYGKSEAQKLVLPLYEFEKQYLANL